MSRLQMRCKSLIVLAFPALACLAPHAEAAILLNTAGNFAVLAGTTVTNTGLSVIEGGSVGVSLGTAITGFPPGTVAAPFTTDPGDATAAQAQTDLATAFNAEEEASDDCRLRFPAVRPRPRRDQTGIDRFVMNPRGVGGSVIGCDRRFEETGVVAVGEFRLKMGAAGLVA
jgi:hypothetical protein